MYHACRQYAWQIAMEIKVHSSEHDDLSVSDSKQKWNVLVKNTGH